MRAVFLLAVLIGVAFGFEKRKLKIEEVENFLKSLDRIVESNYVEIHPGVKVRRDCKVERGIASWYGGRFHGRRTANGEIYDLFKFTAASRTLPLDTYVLVINEENGKVITVRINDRGPYVDGRIIDLSQAAAFKLGMMEKGLAWVKVVPLRCLSPESAQNLYDQVISDLVNTY